MKLWICGLLIAALATCAVAEEKIIIKTSGRPHSWVAYHGPAKISEQDLFSLAQNDELLRGAEWHSNMKWQRLIGGPAMIVAGALLAIRPGQESGEFSVPYVVAGAGVSAFGVYNLVRGFFGHKRYATHESAKEAADKFNTDHGLASE